MHSAKMGAVKPRRRFINRDSDASDRKKIQTLVLVEIDSDDEATGELESIELTALNCR